MPQLPRRRVRVRAISIVCTRRVQTTRQPIQTNLPRSLFVWFFGTFVGQVIMVVQFDVYPSVTDGRRLEPLLQKPMV